MAPDAVELDRERSIDESLFVCLRLRERDSQRWKKRRVCEENQVERDSLVNEETKLMRSGQCALCCKCFFLPFTFSFLFCCFSFFFPRPKSQTWWWCARPLLMMTLSSLPRPFGRKKKIQNINKTKKKSFPFSLVLFFLLAPLPVSLDPSTSSSYDSSADSLRVSSIHWARAHNQTRWGKKKE